MAEFTAINHGVLLPIQEAARVNIGATSSTQIHSATTQGGADDQALYVKDPSVTDQDLLTINARAAVFHSAAQADKDARMQGIQSAAGLRTNDLKITQCLDNISNKDLGELEFVGVAVDAIDGETVKTKSSSSQATTAVRVSGTITAQNPDKTAIPVMSKVRWETTDSPATIRGFKKVRLPVFKPSKSSRVERIMKELFNQRNGRWVGKPFRNADDGGQPSITFKDGMNPYVESVCNEWQARINTLMGSAAGRNDATQHLQVCLDFADKLIEYDSRHHVGTCLGTEEGQIHMLLD